MSLASPCRSLRSFPAALFLLRAAGEVSEGARRGRNGSGSAKAVANLPCLGGCGASEKPAKGAVRRTGGFPRLRPGKGCALAQSRSSGYIGGGGGGGNNSRKPLAILAWGAASLGLGRAACAPPSAPFLDPREAVAGQPCLWTNMRGITTPSTPTSEASRPVGAAPVPVRAWGASRRNCIMPLYGFWVGGRSARPPYIAGLRYVAAMVLFFLHA